MASTLPALAATSIAIAYFFAEIAWHLPRQQAERIRAADARPERQLRGERLAAMERHVAVLHRPLGQVGQADGEGAMEKGDVSEAGGRRADHCLHTSRKATCASIDRVSRVGGGEWPAAKSKMRWPISTGSMSKGWVGDAWASFPSALLLLLLLAPPALAFSRREGGVACGCRVAAAVFFPFWHP
jgi:hypothetical protein